MDSARTIPDSTPSGHLLLPGPSIIAGQQSDGADGVLPPGRVLLAVLLAVVGSLALAPCWLHIGRIWWADPLRVIGAAFPFVSLAGVIAGWRRIGWEMNGSAWGLLPIAASIQLAKLVNIAPFFRFFDAQYWLVIHSGPVVFLYALGAVLLFGGRPLVRRSILPLCLLLCINPVPAAFNVYFDLPLQELSAETARAFAHLIGLHPTGEQLRMMFAPDFGMMIVPGCNGIRGSITLAYLALIYGYTRRLRPGRLLAVSATALLAGYAMNLVRLCLLVVYYRIGLSAPSIQDYGAGVDYAIGCTVFLVGTAALGFLVRSLEPVPVPGPSRAATAQLGARARSMITLRTVCFALLTGVAAVQARAMFSPAVWMPADEGQMMKAMPAMVGPYRLIRTYSEQQYATGGPPQLILGEYAAPAGADGLQGHITMGLYVASGYHRVVDSKLSRGLRPVSTAEFDAVSAGNQHIALGASVYDDGISREFDAETNCTEAGCEDPMATYRQFHASDYLGAARGVHLPLLLRTEWPVSDPRTSAEEYQRFEQEARQFLNALDVKGLVARVGRPLD